MSQIPSEKKLTLEQKIGQVMMIGFNGTTVDPDLRRMIAEYHIGGIILFARNIESPAQVATLTNELQSIALASGSPGLFITIDQEDGTVARLTENKGFAEFSSAKGDPQNARNMAAAMAKEMLAVGINVDFAPDLDVNNNPSNPVIGIRSFSSDPQTVVQYGLEFARGLQRDYGHRLSRAEQTMEASLASAREMEILQMTAPAAVLRIERLTYNQNGILLEYVVSAYRGDRYKFHLTLQ